MTQVVAAPFKPIAGSVVSISATTASANVAIPANALTATSVRIVYTLGTAAVRVRSGVGSGTAAVSTDPLFPNPGSPWVYAECITINANDTYIAAKTDAGTATVEFTFGYGG